jgi:hypothetical protein
MSTPFANLTEENTAQVSRYLRFFRAKKDGLIRTITRDCDEARADRLHEDVYTKEDMEDFSDLIVSTVRSHVVADIGSMVNMSALTVAQLLEVAQDKGIELEVETSAIENVQLLEAVERMNLDSIPKSHKRGLTSMKEETRQLKEQAEAAEELNQRLQDENANLVRKLAVAKRSMGEGKESEEAMNHALAEAKEENEKRVRDTNQFRQMQRIMQKQAADIRELRKRLQRYEPEDDADCKELDD